MKLVETTKGNLYIGSKDDALTLMEGKEGKVYDLIWNLAEELAFLAPDEGKIAKSVLCGNIEDYNIPSNVAIFKEQLNKVVDVLSGGGKVFIHCFGGCGRTGMTLAAIKKNLDGLSGEEAIKFAENECEGPETDSQVNFVLKL
jgi:protein-tyrosine phosphatase